MSLARRQQKCSPFQCITFLSKSWEQTGNWKHEDLLVDCAQESTYRPRSAISAHSGNHRHGLAREKTNSVEPPVSSTSVLLSSINLLPFTCVLYLPLLTSASMYWQTHCPSSVHVESLPVCPPRLHLQLHRITNWLIAWTHAATLCPPVLPKPQVSYKTTSPGVIEANCTSVSRPPAEIVWNVERDNRTVGPPVTTLLPQGDGTTLVISTLTVRSGLLKDVSVKCLVHHKGLESPIAVSMNTKSELGVQCSAEWGRSNKECLSSVLLRRRLWTEGLACFLLCRGFSGTFFFSRWQDEKVASSVTDF